MPQYLRLRQICLVARELEPAVQQLCQTFGVEVCERSPGVARHGLTNAVMPFGPTFMEVVAPFREDTTAGRYLDRIGGDGGYMVILDSDDALRWRAHFATIGVRIAQKLEYPTYQASQLHPKDVGGTLMSIGHDAGGDDLWGDWHAARKEWKRRFQASPGETGGGILRPHPADCNADAIKTTSIPNRVGRLRRARTSRRSAPDVRPTGTSFGRTARQCVCTAVPTTVHRASPEYFASVPVAFSSGR